jgi:transcriptional regulator with PAS, ATPase and Fis domain
MQTSPASMPGHSRDDLDRLLYELQLDKLELEVQRQKLRQSQHEIEESRIKYQELYESIPLGYATIQLSGRICDLNPAGYRLLRLDPQRPLPNFHTFLAEEDVNRFVITCREALTDNRPCTAEFSFVIAGRIGDGGMFLASIDLRPAKASNLTACVRITFQEMTPTKRRPETGNGAHANRSVGPPVNSQDRTIVASPELIGVSRTFADVTALIDAAARVPCTTLIIGETGTGKELIARAIHQRSAERNGPFQVVDCTSFSEGTLESELFGHVRGAFTGAVGDKVGLIERGMGGTVLLDEIGELPLSFQAKLLRVLEEGEMRAVGSVRTKKVRVRFIAATNRDLAKGVQRNEFRKDLFFRLNVMAINVPPLRERLQDIPLLSRHFIARCSKAFGKQVSDLDPSAEAALMSYSWPGNVRELRNIMERAVVLAKSEKISTQDLGGLLKNAAPGEKALGEDYLVLPYAQAKEKVVQDFSRRYIQNKLHCHHGNVSHAAKDAGIPRSYLHRIIRRYVKL